MTAASLVAIPGVATIALAPNLAVFYLGWVLAGSRWPARCTRPRSPR